MSTVTVRAEDEAATARLADDLAAALQPGDAVLLTGPLGAGKSVFARALVRALVGDPALDVPSPTFAIRLDYATPRFPVSHLDLFRLEGAGELDEIGLDEALAEGVLLVEWPERAAGRLEGAAFRVTVEIESDTVRVLRVEAAPAGDAAWRRSRAARAFLDRVGWRQARRAMLKGDASTRAYERVSAPDGRVAILMNSPRKPEGEPVWHGRTYDAVARRARVIDPFLDIGALIRAAGLRVADTLGEDREGGFALLEDLGSDTILRADGTPELSRYAAVVDLLADFHGKGFPALLAADPRASRLPPYDREALLIEVALCADWYLRLPPPGRERFLLDWGRLLDALPAAPPVLVLRDLHSPNVIWQGQAEGHARVGLIDYQDALLGHPAYDLASLAQDARVPLSEADEAMLVGRYLQARAGDPGFDADGFRRAYRILALQRATKVLGGFSRLAAVDGKGQYRRHLDHVRALVSRNLRDPVVAGVAGWFEPRPALLEPEAG